MNQFLQHANYDRQEEKRYYNIFLLEKKIDGITIDTNRYLFTKDYDDEIKEDFQILRCISFCIIDYLKEKKEDLSKLIERISLFKMITSGVIKYYLEYLFFIYRDVGPNLFKMYDRNLTEYNMEKVASFMLYSKNTEKGFYPISVHIFWKYLVFNNIKKNTDVLNSYNTRDRNKLKDIIIEHSQNSEFWLIGLIYDYRIVDIMRSQLSIDISASFIENKKFIIEAIGINEKVIDILKKKGIHIVLTQYDYLYLLEKNPKIYKKLPLEYVNTLTFWTALIHKYPHNKEKKEFDEFSRRNFYELNGKVVIVNSSTCEVCGPNNMKYYLTDKYSLGTHIKNNFTCQTCNGTCMSYHNELVYYNRSKNCNQVCSISINEIDTYNLNERQIPNFYIKKMKSIFKSVYELLLISIRKDKMKDCFHNICEFITPNIDLKTILFYCVCSKEFKNKIRS